MSEPETDIGERTRREMQAKIDAKDAELSRYNMMVGQTRIEMKIDALAGVLSAHISDDKVMAQEFKAMIKENSEKITSVSSSANKEQVNSRFTLKEMVAGWIMLCAVLSGFIVFMMKLFPGGKP